MDLTVGKLYSSSGVVLNRKCNRCSISFSEPSFEGEPPRCPQLDCSEVEAEMPCALDRRVNSDIDIYGETCDGCRRCLDENEVPVDKDVKTTQMIPKETTTKTTTTTTTNTPVTATEKAESSSKKPQPLVRTLKMPCWLMEMFCRNWDILQERQMPAGWLDCNSCQ
ncbi:hypothetical protein LSAT2_003498 [Lamellibrachia satsuma]|nr:hypothetical protein LSAT2_003498 [Lamellibrachia satsuma]